ncbi:MAG: phosphoglycerate mutase family protein [Myxococcota bacterium]|jgi:phosphohistidine phosphatase|nr:phosphoglycerate mutase family protein [Myxococcota bacterium]
MRFLFVRHGHKAHGAGNDQPLTERGEQEARDMGRFLVRQGIVPDLIVHTGKKRTRKTAELLLEALAPARVPVKDGGSGFRSGCTLAELEARLDRWVALGEGEVGTLLFVGHCKQQQACLARLGAPAGVEVQTHDRTVLVYTQGEHGWELGPWWVDGQEGAGGAAC